MSYPKKYREKALEIKEKEGLTYAETSTRFGIGIASLYRWKKRIEEKIKRNKPSTKIDMKALEEDVRKNPDTYYYERAKEFHVGISTIYYAFKRLGISYKKNSESPEGRRSGTYTIPDKNDETPNSRT